MLRIYRHCWRAGFARDVRATKRSVSAQLGFREARQSHLSPLHAYCILPEREQNGIYILNDFNSNYRDRLLSLNFLPLMMQLELFDIQFFIRCLKDPDTTQEFSIHSFVQFSDRNTRSSSHLKLKHSLSKSTTEAHLFFNRLPRLWNSLPPINIDLSISTIKAHLHRLFWMKFQSHFVSSNPCSYHYQCPCPKCVSMSIVHTFSSSQF